MPKIFGPTVAPENKLLVSCMSLWTRVTLASNYTARKVDYTIAGNRSAMS